MDNTSGRYYITHLSSFFFSFPLYFFSERNAPTSFYLFLFCVLCYYNLRLAFTWTLFVHVTDFIFLCNYKFWLWLLSLLSLLSLSLVLSLLSGLCYLLFFFYLLDWFLVTLVYCYVKLYIDFSALIIMSKYDRSGSLQTVTNDICNSLKRLQNQLEVLTNYKIIRPIL